MNSLLQFVACCRARGNKNTLGVVDANHAFLFVEELVALLMYEFTFGLEILTDCRNFLFERLQLLVDFVFVILDFLFESGDTDMLFSKPVFILAISSASNDL